MVSLSDTWPLKIRPTHVYLQKQKRLCNLDMNHSLLFLRRKWGVFVVSPSDDMYYRWLFVIAIAVLYNWILIVAR